MDVHEDSQDTSFPELGSPEDLEQRLRLLPVGDMARGFVFTSILETVRQDAGAEALQRCLAVVGETTFLSFFNYPFRSLLKLLYTGAWELSEKRGGFDGAMRWIARGTVPSFLQSSVGRVLLSVGGVNMKRLINGFPLAYPTVFSHGACKVIWTGERSGLGRMSGILLPTLFLESSMARMLEPLQPRGLFIRARRLAPMEMEMEFSWQ